MIRSALGKVAWMARATTTVVGLAIMLALVLGVATSAMGANGGSFILGKVNNAATAVTGLVGDVDGAAMRVTNTNAGANDTALDLRVQAGEAPMRVNSAAKVANLNADKLDGLDAGSLAPRSGFDATEVIATNGPLTEAGKEGTFTSKGGKLIIMASGSAFRSSTNARGEGRIGVAVTLDGSGRVMGGYTNQMNIHKNLVSDFFVSEGVAAGTHTIRVSVFNDFDCNGANEDPGDICTTTDQNDFFRVTVLEIPD